MSRVLRFLSLFLASLALAPALAHALELPHKIDLPAEEYRTVQQIYRGWSLLGAVVIGALLATLAFAVAVRDRPRSFGLVLTAFLCIAGTQAVFWTLTYPVNRQTANWTVLPENWSALRARWEYSHAASAALNLLAVLALALEAAPAARADEPKLLHGSA